MATYFCTGSGSDSGDGTIGNPWTPRSGGKSALQHALDTITRSASGDKICLKQTDTLNATLSLATYGTPTNTGGLLITGYTAIEDDGTFACAGIDGAGTYAIWDHSTVEGVKFSNLALGNCGTATVITTDRMCSLTDCKVYGTSGSGWVNAAENPSAATRVWFDDIGTYGADSVQYFDDCLFTDGSTNKFDRAVLCNDEPSFHRCCFLLNAVDTTAAIFVKSSRFAHVTQCSFLHTGGVGSGIDNWLPHTGGLIKGCLFEGFGTGIKNQANTYNQSCPIVDCSFFNNTTDYDVARLQELPGVEKLGATPFDKAGSITAFADRKTYFNPVDTGSVRSDNLHRGAVQAAAGGGTGLIGPGGGMIGIGAI